MKTHSHKNTFSLIELLVVIAIFSVLASMLQPALRKTFSTARALACIRNESLVFGYMSSYLDDHSGVYAPATKTNSNQWHDQITYDDYLSAYDGRNMTNRTSVRFYYPNAAVGGEEVYRCTEEALTGWGDQLLRTYALNSGGYNPSTKSYEGPVGQYIGAGIEPSASIRDVPNPSQVFLFVEIRSFKDHYAATQNVMSGGQNGYYTYCANANWQNYGHYGLGKTYLEPWHDDSWNYMFADGHAERLMPLETISNDDLTKSSKYWTKRTDD